MKVSVDSSVEDFCSSHLLLELLQSLHLGCPPRDPSTTIFLWPQNSSPVDLKCPYLELFHASSSFSFSGFPNSFPLLGLILSIHIPGFFSLVSVSLFPFSEVLLLTTRPGLWLSRCVPLTPSHMLTLLAHHSLSWYHVQVSSEHLLLCDILLGICFLICSLSPACQI